MFIIRALESLGLRFFQVSLNRFSYKVVYCEIRLPRCCSQTSNTLFGFNRWCEIYLYMDWEAVKMGAVAINKINYKLKKSTMKETEKTS